MPRPSAPDLFDQWAQATHSAALEQASVAHEEALSPNREDPQPAATATPAALRRALQELLKHGLLEEGHKPQLYRQLLIDAARVNTLLEPLDLQLQIDDVRGLAFVVIAPTYQPDGEDEDEWTHPLVRRQRMTLEQSLLLAILRREFLQHEQERGTGVPVVMAIERLLPQLEIYLGATGSDMHERKRLLNLLENLRTHGVVSEVDAQECITIRPMIVHIANPHNLQALLQHLRAMTATTSTPQEPADD